MYHQVKAIFQSFQFWKNMRIRTYPPSLRTVSIMNCWLFYFWCWSSLPFGLFILFALGHFYGLLLWRHIFISMSLVYNLPRRGRGSKLCVKCVKGPNETPRHLLITNFGALNNLLQKELLIRALYTHLIEEGGEELGKETKSAQIKKWMHWAVIYFFHTIQIKKKETLKN